MRLAMETPPAPTGSSRTAFPLIKGFDDLSALSDEQVAAALAEMEEESEGPASIVRD